jgi:glutamate decarboxylase
MKNLTLTADYLAEKLEDTGYFEILSARNGQGVPLVAFHLKQKKIYDEASYPSKNPYLDMISN